MALDETLVNLQAGHAADHAALRTEAAGRGVTIDPLTAGVSTPADHQAVHQALHTNHNLIGAPTTLPTGVLTGSHLAHHNALHAAYNTREGVTIAEENALTGNGSSEWNITDAGDLNNVGYVRQFGGHVGTTINFACHGTGTVIDIYRIGYYNGLGWRKVATITNTATSQPAAQTIASTNGGTTCSNWTNTASWAIPADAVSGLYIGVYRNAALTNMSWIPFVVRDDNRAADIIITTSDATWALAYNYYGTPGSPTTGRTLYGIGTDWTIGDRCHAVTYERPVITRLGNFLTYWMNAEAPLIRWAERNGFNVKYVSKRDIEKTPSCLNGAKVIISSGHDEYWSQTMRDTVEARRDAGTHLLFLSGNELFWRTRFVGEVMYCYKDTMSGPGGHTAGVALDPVTWTGTWRDTRWGSSDPESNTTGTFFRMNAMATDPSVTLQTAAAYADHPVWRNSSLVTTNTTFTRVIGFEADEIDPQQPAGSQALLASSVININGAYADDNGQNYTGAGSLNPWGIIAQRYASGAVVVGFGTCQWQWALDATHDRDATGTVTAAQQMMLNLLADLGAAAATPQAGLTVPTPVSLNNYGAIP